MKTHSAVFGRISILGVDRRRGARIETTADDRRRTAEPRRETAVRGPGSRTVFSAPSGARSLLKIGSNLQRSVALQHCELSADVAAFMCDDRRPKAFGRQTAEERREAAVRGAGNVVTEYSPGCPPSAVFPEVGTPRRHQLTDLKCYLTLNVAGVCCSSSDGRNGITSHVPCSPSVGNRQRHAPNGHKLAVVNERVETGAHEQPRLYAVPVEHEREDDPVRASSHVRG